MASRDKSSTKELFCTQHLPQVTNSTPWLCHPSAQTSDSCKWQKIVPWHKRRPWQAAHLAQRSGFSDKKHVDYPEVFGYFRPREEGKRSHLHNWDSGIGAWQDRTVPQVPLSQWTRFFKGSSWKMGKTAENNYQDPSALLKTQKLFFMVFQIAWWQHSAACDAQPHTWERKSSCKACKRRQEAGMNLLKEWHSCERKTSRRAAAHTPSVRMWRERKKCQHFETFILLEEQIIGSVEVVVFPQCSISIKTSINLC